MEWGGDVAQLVERRTGTPLRQVRFPGAARDSRPPSSPESTFSADSLTCVRTPPCAMACINICEHVKDPVDHVRVRWIMEKKKLKHPACTVCRFGQRDSFEKGVRCTNCN